MSTGGERETAKRVLSARRTRKDEERRKRERESEREGEKEIQRLPYNGAPRAHKLRHNVISSSLFNERWQRAAHTFYPGVLVVPAPVGLFTSPSLILFYDALFGAPPSSSPRTCCEPCVALHCQVAVSNVIHLLIEPEPSRAARPFPRLPVSRIEISFPRRECVTCAANHHFSITRARDMHHSYDCRICIRALRLRAGSFAARCIHTAAPWISVPADYRVDARFNA